MDAFAIIVALRFALLAFIYGRYSALNVSGSFIFLIVKYSLNLGVCVPRGRKMHSSG
jgi:hypothetical protein